VALAQPPSLHPQIPHHFFDRFSPPPNAAHRRAWRGKRRSACMFIASPRNVFARALRFPRTRSSCAPAQTGAPQACQSGRSAPFLAVAFPRSRSRCNIKLRPSCDRPRRAFRAHICARLRRTSLHPENQIACHGSGNIRPSQRQTFTSRRSENGFQDTPNAANLARPTVSRARLQHLAVHHGHAPSPNSPSLRIFAAITPPRSEKLR